MATQEFAALADKILAFIQEAGPLAEKLKSTPPPPPTHVELAPSLQAENHGRAVMAERPKRGRRTDVEVDQLALQVAVEVSKHPQGIAIGELLEELAVENRSLMASSLNRAIQGHLIRRIGLKRGAKYVPHKMSKWSA